MLIPLQDGFANESTDRAVEDIIVRFIINAPAEDFADTSRLLFLCEEAQWFYQDYISSEYPNAQPLGFKAFFKKVVEICPVIWQFKETPDEAIKNFNQYKQTIPVRGAALFNSAYDKILLVQGMESPSWSFPRGKISKDENDMKCAIREVQEEINYDITPHIKENEFIERNIRGKNYKIYLCKDIPDNYPFRPTVRCEINEIKWQDFKWVSNKIKNSSSQDNRFFLLQAFIRPMQDWIKRNRGDFNESQLKQQVETHLKHILGISGRKTCSDQTKPVADPGREILDLLKQSSEAKKEEKDTQFLQQLFQKSNEVTTAPYLTNQQNNIPQNILQPQFLHHQAYGPYNFPPGPIPGFVPGMPLGYNTQHLLPPQQFLQGLPQQFVGNMNFGDQLQKFQTAHLPPHPMFQVASSSFYHNNNNNNGGAMFPPNAQDLQRPSFVRNEGETKELLSILNKPTQTHRRESITTSSENKMQGNEYSKGLLALLSKKGSSFEDLKNSSSSSSLDQPVVVQLGSPIQEKPSPVPKSNMRMLKREVPGTSGSLSDLLKPKNFKNNTETSNSQVNRLDMGFDLDGLQQRVDEAYENDKSIHSSFINQESSFSSPPSSSNNNNSDGMPQGLKKLKILKRGEFLPFASATENDNTDSIVSNVDSTSQSSICDQNGSSSHDNVKYKEYDNNSLVSTIQFSDEEEDFNFKNDFSQIVEEDEDENGNGNIEEDYEQFESYDEDEEDFKENEKFLQYNQEKFDSELNQKQVSIDHEDDESGDDQFYDSSDENRCDQSESVVDEQEEDSVPELNGVKDDDEEEWQSDEKEEEEEDLKASDVQKSSPVPDLLSLIQGKASQRVKEVSDRAEPTKRHPLSLDDIESSYSQTSTNSSNVKNEIFGLLHGDKTVDASSPNSHINGSNNLSTPINDPSSSLLGLLQKKIQAPLTDVTVSEPPKQQPIFLEDIEQPQRPSSTSSRSNGGASSNYAGSTLMNILHRESPGPTRLNVVESGQTSNQVIRNENKVPQNPPLFKNSPIMHHQHFQNSPMLPNSQFQQSPMPQQPQVPFHPSPAFQHPSPMPVQPPFIPFNNSPVPHFPQLTNGQLPPPPQFMSSQSPKGQMYPSSRGMSPAPFQQYHQGPPQQQYQQIHQEPMSFSGTPPPQPFQSPLPMFAQPQQQVQSNQTNSQGQAGGSLLDVLFKK